MLAADCHPRLAWVSSSLWLVYHCTTCASAAGPIFLVCLSLLDWLDVSALELGQQQLIDDRTPVFLVHLSSFAFSALEFRQQQLIADQAPSSWCTYCLLFQHWNWDSSSWLSTKPRLPRWIWLPRCPCRPPCLPPWPPWPLCPTSWPLPRPSTRLCSPLCSWCLIPLQVLPRRAWPHPPCMALPSRLPSRPSTRL